jgi:iron complex outermembrane receptor protein
VEGQFSARQSRTAEFELPTDSHFLVNASLGYQASIGGVETDFYIKGVNLTNEEARLHTSFLKDIAPLGGRGVVVGVKVEF